MAGMDMTGTNATSAADHQHGWQSYLSNDPSQHAPETFCVGNGMVHYMDGFHMTLTGGHPCLVLWFNQWILDTPAKFAGAMVGIFFFSMSVEGFTKLRHDFFHRAQQRVAAVDEEIEQDERKENEADEEKAAVAATSMDKQVDDPSSRLDRKKKQRDAYLKFVHVSVTALRAFQGFVGYALMLIAMSFSGELIIMIVAGLAAGHVVFYQRDPQFLRPHQKNKKNGNKKSDDDDDSCYEGEETKYNTDPSGAFSISGVGVGNGSIRARKSSSSTAVKAGEHADGDAQKKNAGESSDDNV